jgi:hypothetical protein
MGVALPADRTRSVARCREVSCSRRTIVKRAPASPSQSVGCVFWPDGVVNPQNCATYLLSRVARLPSILGVARRATTLHLLVHVQFRTTSPTRYAHDRPCLVARRSSRECRKSNADTGRWRITRSRPRSLPAPLAEQRPIFRCQRQLLQQGFRRSSRDRRMPRPRAGVSTYAPCEILSHAGVLVPHGRPYVFRSPIALAWKRRPPLCTPFEQCLTQWPGSRPQPRAPRPYTR